MICNNDYCLEIRPLNQIIFETAGVSINVPIKLIMWHAITWSMRKMGKAIIHSKNIWVARLFRRSSAMLTRYAVCLVALSTL